jgi:hypothetical protein
MTVPAEEPFDGLLKRVSNEFYQGVFHQDFGRTVHQQPRWLSGTLCQWLSWHPAEVADLGSHEAIRNLGLQTQGIRFQPPDELANVPPALCALQLDFFEDAGDIGALAIYRDDCFTEATMARLLRELRLTAQRIAFPDA